MATLINGNLNSPIFASQDADLLAAICGNQTVIAPVGNQFAHELEDANTIKVDDGVIITKEGRRIQLDAGDIDEFIIPTGTQGQTHYFLCGYHLYTDEESAELCETFVEPAESASETIDEDTFREGNTEVYVTLFRVTQVGVNITDVEELLAAGTDIKGLQQSVSAINESLTDLGDAQYIRSITTVNGTVSVSELADYRNIGIALRIDNYNVIDIKELSISLLKGLGSVKFFAYESPSYNIEAYIYINSTDITLTTVNTNGWAFTDVAIFGIK